MNKFYFNLNQAKCINISIAFFCLLSMGTSLSFWSNLPNNLFSQVLFGGFAVLFEAVKYLAAWDIFQKRKVSRKILSVSIHAVLLVISVFGTVGLLKSWVESGQKEKTEQLQEYQIANSRVNSKRELIADLNALAKKELDNNYRTRSVKILDQVTAEQAHLAELEERLLSIRGASAGSIMDACGAGGVANILLLIMGALLEISGAYLFSLKHALAGDISRSNFKINADSSHKRKLCNKPKIIKAKEKVLSASNGVDVGDPVDLSYHRVKIKILNNELRPVTREIKEFTKLGSQKVNDLMHLLVANGVLEKTKTKRFVVRPN